MGRVAAAWCLRLWALDLVVWSSWYGALSPALRNSGYTLAWSLPLMALVVGMPAAGAPARDPQAAGRWHLGPAFAQGLVLAALAFKPGLDGLLKTGLPKGSDPATLGGMLFGAWVLGALLLTPILWLARRLTV